MKFIYKHLKDEKEIEELVEVPDALVADNPVVRFRGIGELPFFLEKETDEQPDRVIKKPEWLQMLADQRYDDRCKTEAELLAESAIE